MEEQKIPRCVAVIMDGNRRWAEKRGLPKEAGHLTGYEAFKKIVREAERCGIRTLIVDAFALKNWGRKKKEVDALMQLFAKALGEAEKEFSGETVRLRFIGDRIRLPAKLASRTRWLEDSTRHRAGLQLVIALSYGGRDDIVRSVQHLVNNAAREGALQVTEELFGKYLGTGVGIPDPDLIIRTGGEHRLSDFLPWESADSELYFTETLWPDFDEAELRSALANYARRQRRFGK